MLENRSDTSLNITNATPESSERNKNHPYKTCSPNEYSQSPKLETNKQHGQVNDSIGQGK